MSTQIKTHQIFPTYHSNTFTSFDIPSKVYLNTFRLANVQAKPNVDATYQPLVGMNALFKHIILYSQNSIIDQSREAPEYLAFEQLRKPNVYNSNMGNPQTGTIWGFKESHTVNANRTPLAAQTLIPSINYTKSSSSVKPIKTLVTLANSGTFNLQDCLKFLTSDAIVPGTQFPSMRLTIEWETDAALVFGKTVPASWDVVEPILFVDEVITPSILQSVSKKRNYKIPYFSMEKDRVVVSAVVADTIKQETIPIRGFKDKSVRRMLLVNVPDVSSALLKQNASTSQYKEVINVRLNGKTFFPSVGINSENKKLDLLQQAWGQMNCYQGSQFIGLENDENFLSTTDLGATYDATAAKIVTTKGLQGFVSYGGFVLQSPISDLEIEYSRTGYGVDKSSVDNGINKFFLDVYGEVYKSLEIRNGQLYSVNYE